MYQSNTAHRAAVVDRDRRVHFPDGKVSAVRIDPRDLTLILAGTVNMAQHTTIVVDGASIADHTPHAARLTGAGWAHKTVGPWTLYHHDRRGQTCAVGLRDEMGPRHLGVLVDQADDPSVLAMLLDRYARLTGINWRGTPATTALAKIRMSWENAREMPRWNHVRMPGGHATGPLIWHRELNARELEWGYVHTFDASSAYLGSAANAELAWSTIEHTGPREFDKHTPGYWHCELTTPTLAWCSDPTRPPLIPPARIRDSHAWLTTPLVWLLGELGEAPRVIDSMTGVDRHGRRSAARVLRTWGEELRDARTAAEQLPPGMRDRLVVAVKRTYKDATGGMQREGMRVYRPDWAHTLIDLWRVTLIRRIIRVHESQGVWPVAVKTDSVSYADCVDRPQPRAATRHYGAWADTLTDALTVTSCTLGCGCARGTGTQLGTYKHEASCTTDQWTTAHAPKVRAAR